LLSNRTIRFSLPLVHGDLDIFDSTQIFEYLEDLQPTPALWPLDIPTAIIGSQWLSRVNVTLDMAARPTTLRRARLRRAHSIQSPLTRPTSPSRVINPRQFS
jgi:glutathione S-transferase